MRKTESLINVSLRLIIVLIILLHSNVTAQERTDIPEFDGFEEYVEKVMAQWKLPGMAVGVVKDGEIIYLKGFGYRDVEKKLPVTTKTLFGIASCTKAFTAVAIGILIDEGKLSLNTPIIDFIPDFRAYDEYTTMHATVRDLLYHRTGIPGHNKVKIVSSVDREEMFKRLRYLKPNKTFRELFQYSNLSYQMAGYIVDRVSDSPYEEFVSERIFKPLNMKNSCFYSDNLIISENCALPYLNFSIGFKMGNVFHYPDYFTVCRSYGDITSPSGGIHSSAEDMVKWIKLHLNRGKAGNKQIISTKNLGFVA